MRHTCRSTKALTIIPKGEKVYADPVGIDLGGCGEPAQYDCIQRPVDLVGLVGDPALHSSCSKRGTCFSYLSLSKSTLFTRHPYRSGNRQRFANKEVHDVSILFRNRGISRCRRGFYLRAGSVGRESLSQEPDRRSPAELI